MLTGYNWHGPVACVCVCVCLICYLCGEHRAGVEGLQVLCVGFPGPSRLLFLPVVSLLLCPLEGPLGNDSTGQLFLGLAGMFAQPLLVVGLHRPQKPAPSSYFTLLVAMAV